MGELVERQARKQSPYSNTSVVSRYRRTRLKQLFLLIVALWHCRHLAYSLGGLTLNENFSWYKFTSKLVFSLNCNTLHTVCFCFSVGYTISNDHSYSHYGIFTYIHMK